MLRLTNKCASVSVVSVIRLTVLLKLTTDDATCTHPHHPPEPRVYLIRNRIGTYVPTGVWTNIEVLIGIVTACVPAFWPLLRAIATGKFRASNPRSATDLKGSNRTHSQSEPKMFLSRSNNVDNEKGFLHLHEVPTMETWPTSQWGERKDVLADKPKTGPPVLVKPAQRAMTPSWRG